MKQKFILVLSICVASGASAVFANEWPAERDVTAAERAIKKAQSSAAEPKQVLTPVKAIPAAAPKPPACVAKADSFSSLNPRQSAEFVASCRVPANQVEARFRHEIARLNRDAMWKLNLDEDRSYHYVPGKLTLSPEIWLEPGEATRKAQIRPLSRLGRIALMLDADFCFAVRNAHEIYEMPSEHRTMHGLHTVNPAVERVEVLQCLFIAEGGILDKWSMPSRDSLRRDRDFRVESYQQ